MPDREKVEEWARSFKAYVDELDIARDDYRGIMEYIDDALALLREQEPVKPTEKDGWHYCGACGRSIDSDFADEEVFLYCPNCGRKVKLHA